MDKELLNLTRQNLMEFLVRCREESVPVDQKLELIIFSLADIAAALASD